MTVPTNAVIYQLGYSRASLLHHSGNEMRSYTQHRRHKETDFLAVTNRQQPVGREGLSGNVKAAYPVLLHSLAFTPILYTWNLLNGIFELAD